MTSYGTNFASSLRWNSETGYGYLPVDELGLPEPYDEKYFQKYQQYAKTSLGDHITLDRINFVNKFYVDELVDIGIGCGQFVAKRNSLEMITLGEDVNPAGISWLKSNSWLNEEHTIRAASYWDSLEHIKDAKKHVARVQEWVFVTIPIFKNLDHVLRSKHFRPDEHYHYFTHGGIVSWMWNSGFRLKGQSDFEIKLGREDVQTYAFKRS